MKELFIKDFIRGLKKADAIIINDGHVNTDFNFIGDMFHTSIEQISFEIDDIEVCEIVKDDFFQTIRIVLNNSNELFFKLFEFSPVQL